VVDASDEFGASDLDRSRIDEDAELLPAFSDMGSKLTSFAGLVQFLNHKLLEQEDERWLANSAKGTREAFIRRMRGAAAYMKNIVRGDLTESELRSREFDILKSNKQILVVDIHSLAPLAQMFVVGVLLKQLFMRQESAKSYGKTFIVLDELNKYAPSEGDSPIKDVLLDIAERGRSLGVILIGAQQTASEVERRIVSNAAVRVVGRLDAAEGQRGEYAFLPGILRQRASILAPGTMVVHQPDVPSPLIVNFPFPAWATREAETRKKASQLSSQDVEEERQVLLDKWA
jgi:DNA helicase HerA-like ATPase